MTGETLTTSLLMDLIAHPYDILFEPLTTLIMLSKNIAHGHLGHRLVIAQLITGNTFLSFGVHVESFGTKAEKEIDPMIVDGSGDRR